MEIVYLWIDKYKSIEKKGFHFNNDLIVEITAIDNSVIKGSIKRSLKSHKYKLFDNAITNFTAIVGANGSGKSSLIEFIFNEVKTDHSNYAYFLIGKNVKNQYILYNHIIGYNFDNPSKIEFIITDDDDKIEFKFDKIFYSIFFDFNTSLYNNTSHDLTTFNLLKKIRDEQKYNLNEYNQVEIFRINELNRQINFVGSKFSKMLPFKQPNKIELRPDFNNINRLSEDFKVKDWLADDVLKQTTIKKMESCLLENHLNLDVQSISNYLLYDFISRTTNQSTLISIIQIFENETFEKWSFKSVISYFTKFCDNSLFDRKIDNIDNIISFIKYIYKNTIPYSFNIEENKIKFNEFIYIYLNSIKGSNGFINFSWHQISSGENAMINLFSRLFSIRQKLKKTYTLLILLDEAETGFHPMWQKKIIDLLNDYLPKLYKNKIIQIILTSHSPYVVSDLPKENIIFLKKEKNKCVVDNSLNHEKTFGANIHTLLTDSFFLDDGLIGDFAKRKIYEILDTINSNQLLENKERIEYLIDLIGEPIIKQKLIEELTLKMKSIW